MKKTYEQLKKRLYEVPGTKEYMESKEVKEHKEACLKAKQASLKK